MRLIRPFLTILIVLTGLLDTSANDSTRTATWNSVSKTFAKKEVSIRELTTAVKTKMLQNLEIIDARYDISSVGNFTNNFNRGVNITFKGAASLQDILNQVFLKYSDNTPVILLAFQDFWITDISNADSDPLHPLPRGSRVSKLICKVDVFIKQLDKYLPLVRIDSTIWNNKRALYSTTELLAEALDLIQDKIEAAFTAKKFANRSRFSKEEIHNEYQKRFDVAAIVDELPKKGVYLSFEEFLKNAPSIKNFSIKPGKDEPPSLYIIDEKGNESFTRTAWGVSDGNNLYIMQSGLLFRLFKNDHGFHWMGVKDMKVKQRGIPIIIPLPGGFLYGADPTSSYLKISLTPYLLNMQTGEEY